MQAKDGTRNAQESRGLSDVDKRHKAYMPAGKPIIGAIDGETRVVIAEAKCGFCGKADDETELAENIKKFIGSDNILEMGKNARRYYEENFDKMLFMDKLEFNLI